MEFASGIADIPDMAKNTRNDPYGQFNFLLEIDGVVTAGFSEVSGLTTETSVIEYREGSDRTSSVRKLPGLTKYSNIVLKRGITKDRSLWDWRKTVIDGATRRVDGSIILLDESRQEVVRWNFRAGWPSKWEGPTLNAKSSDVAIETLEIAHEGFDLA
jgi:phage tail-like protein